MSYSILPFIPQQSSAVPIEINRLDSKDAARSLPPHAHTFFELIIITSGSGQVTVNGRAYQATRDRVFYIRPGISHDISGLCEAEGWGVLFLPDAAAGATYSRGLAATFIDHDTSEFFRPLRGAESIDLDIKTIKLLDQLLAKADTDLRDHTPGYESSVHVTLHLILTLIQGGRDVGQVYEDAAAAAPGVRESLLLRRVFVDIDTHYVFNPSLEAAARRLNMNSAHLTTRLRKLTGRTYGEWVLERRMIEARHLLASTPQTLSQIAQQLGYQNLESFIRRFRAQHEITPGRWREATQRRSDENYNNAA